MLQFAVIPSRSSFVLFVFLAGFALPVAAAADAHLVESYGKLPLHFEANHGQTDEAVRFLSRGSGYKLYLTASEAVLVLTRPSPGENGKRNAQASPGPRAQGESVALRMALVGANRKPLVGGLDQLPGKANYFIGKDQSNWRTNVPTYAKVHYREVYPGIDLVYYGNQRQLEYDFVVAPGADPKKIVLGFKGADEIQIDAEGNLVLHTAGGEIRQHKPIVYQELDGVRQEIVGSYVRRGAHRVGFELAAYDAGRPLVIDPVLVYSTYLGGSGFDSGAGPALDADGNAYMAGSTNSIDFPTTAGVFQGTGGTSFDIFVTKLNPTGSALVYSTYLGGSDRDTGVGIALDVAGNAYVGGSTRSPDFPTTANAFQRTFGGIQDAFAVKLDPAGSALVYSTYVGGADSDSGGGIAICSTGTAHLTGWTRSTNFPTTAEAAQANHGGGMCSSPSGTQFPCEDAFVTRLDSAGSALVYSTYLGGSTLDFGLSITVDASSNSYVTGQTFSTDFPTSAGAFQPTFGGSVDAFVTKLNPTGSALVYSTFLGGSDRDTPGGIAVDRDGNAYVTGSTGFFGPGSNFPTTPGAFQPSIGNNPTCPPCTGDAFVTKLNATGTGLVYSTFLGGNDDDGGAHVAVDTAGTAYVTGSTRSSNFPTTANAVQPAPGGFADVFVTELDPTGSSLIYSTYLGGEDDDQGTGIAVDANGNAYVGGRTASSNFPTTAGAFQSGFGGGADAFVAKIAHVQASSSTTRFEESAAAYSGNWPSYGAESGAFSEGTIRASPDTTASASFSFTGTAITWIGVKCDVCGIALVSINGGAPTTVNTAGPGRSGSLTSEPVFSASGLAPDVTHTIVITATGTTTALQSLLVGGTYVAVDAFDVTR